MKADVAYCGEEGVQQVQDRVKLVQRGEAQMYKIIFLDYSMPDLDGPCVAVKIRKILSKAGLP